MDVSPSDSAAVKSRPLGLKEREAHRAALLKASSGATRMVMLKNAEVAEEAVDSVVDEDKPTERIWIRCVSSRDWPARAVSL